MIEGVMVAALATVVRLSTAGLSTTESNFARRVNLISASPLFSGLSRQACEEIARRAQSRVYDRDELLFMQGATVRNLMLICSGGVRLSQFNSIGSSVILWMFGAGSVIGVASEPTSCYHTCSARAIEPTAALVWEQPILQSLIQTYPKLNENICVILDYRLHELEERSRELATSNVARCFHLTLRGLVKQMGKRLDGGIGLSISAEKLAQVTCATLFTLCRLLSKWEDKSLILPRRCNFNARTSPA
jgi:CRP-like cAMP-binding protein